MPVRAGQPRPRLRPEPARRLRGPTHAGLQGRRPALRRPRGLALVRRQGRRVQRPRGRAARLAAGVARPHGRRRRRPGHPRAAADGVGVGRPGRPGPPGLRHVHGHGQAPPPTAVTARPHPPRLRTGPARATARRDPRDRLLRPLADRGLAAPERAPVSPANSGYAGRDVLGAFIGGAGLGVAPAQVARPRRKNGVSTTRAGTGRPRTSTPISLPGAAAWGGTNAKPMFLPRLGANEPLVTRPAAWPPT